MPDPTPAPTPAQYGVGARLSLYPMTADFVEVILGALADADASGVQVGTDDVSTSVRGDEAAVLRYLHEVIAHAAGTGVHTVAHLLLSRGCPGEVTCEVADGQAWAPGSLPELAHTGLRASAHWSLYPLVDGGPGTEAQEHMTGIQDAIEHAKERGTFTRAEHYATRLDGDLADVLATIAGGWLLVGRQVRHVTSHATVSLSSPSSTAEVTR